ncbi:MAG: CocE/NonD family hydrolase, partial [bacterium]|nr:CocE/NonD family hydrolase [bacterium]
RRAAAGSVVLLGAPLEEHYEVTGFPEASLFVSSTAEATAFSVKLIDVHPDGPWALVSRAIKNTSQRDSRTDPEPLVPGEVTEVTIELEAVSYLFEAGHRMGIMVSSSDFPLVWPLPQNAVNTIHMDADHPTRISLPVVNRPDSGLPPPDYRPAHPLPDPLGTAEPTRWDLVEDLAGTEVSVVISMGGDATNDNGARIHTHTDFKATTDRADPANSSVEAGFRFDVDHGASRTEIKSSTRVVGCYDSFHAVTALEVQADGMPHFSRTWHTSTPRGSL